MSDDTFVPSLGTLLQRFFLEHMIQQRNASPRTVAAYRDTFRLLLGFAERRLGVRPAALTLENLSATLILDFLSHLENERQNAIRTRNARFAAIRSFMHYVSLNAPAALSIAQPVLAIPMKRFERPLIGFSSRGEMQALLNAPNPDTWSGQRDRVMFATLYNTGARVSELTGLRVDDLLHTPAASIRIQGKGRKERRLPLWRDTAKKLDQWIDRQSLSPQSPLFPNRAGGRLTRTSVSDRLKGAAAVAAEHFPELAKRRVHPHLVRHSTAMHLLQSGVDITVIALWLGHESPATTHTYVEADLEMKERAMQALAPPDVRRGRYRPTDKVLAFLKGL